MSNEDILADMHGVDEVGGLLEMKPIFDNHYMMFHELNQPMFYDPEWDSEMHYEH